LKAQNLRGHRYRYWMGKLMSLKTTTIVNELSRRFEEVEASIKGTIVKGIIHDLEVELGDALKDLMEAAIQRDLRRSLEMVDWIERHYSERLRGVLEELLGKVLARLPASVRTTMMTRDGADLAERLAKLLHILYLHSGDEYFYNVAVIFYAVKLALSERHLRLTLIAALMRLLSLGDVDGAHAMAAHAVRDVLERIPPYRLPKKGPAEDVRMWALALRIAYDLDLAARVEGELLYEWGFFDEVTNKD